MKMLAFATRVRKEILRDPINLFFGLGFPILLLLLFTAIGKSVPDAPYSVESVAPGIAVFSLSFLTLFSATLISRDRESALLVRLYATPLRASDFIFGYALWLLPIALLMGLVCFLAAVPLGLRFTGNTLLAVLLLLPIAWLQIALGLLFGSILGVRQVGGICGALVTNLSAWLSGAWFDLSLIGGGFERIASILPFSHATELVRAAISGELGDRLWHLFPILGYAAALSALASLLFLRQMKKQ